MPVADARATLQFCYVGTGENPYRRLNLVVAHMISVDGAGSLNWKNHLDLGSRGKNQRRWKRVSDLEGLAQVDQHQVIAARRKTDRLTWPQ